VASQIFANVLVKSLDRSMEPFAELGFAFDPRFTDETAACMIVSDTIYGVLLTEEKFQEFTPKAICDATRSTEVLVCLSCETRDRVDELVAAAVAAGATIYSDPKGEGFMYAHGFQDLDGHIWELMYMDPGLAS
jgi:predicted lactoylglutathione lyase